MDAEKRALIAENTSLRAQVAQLQGTVGGVFNKRLGLSHGKIAWIFEKVFKLKIERSTSARSVVRMARHCAVAYEQIRGDVRAAEEVTPDETGWRVGGGKAWLHAFATARTTCYEIDPTRSGEVAERLLGLDRHVSPARHRSAGVLHQSPHLPKPSASRTASARIR
jgi:hypothetical protein